MLVGETLRSALRSLSSNRLRTALTALGMVIGVAAVVAVLAIGEGARASVERQIRSLGSNLLTVRPERSTVGGVRGGPVETLTRGDVEAIARLEGVVASSGETTATAQVKYLENNLSSSVVGVTPAYMTIRSLEVASGLAFSDEDDAQRRRVAVIGANVAETLFGSGSPLGERIQIRGVAFRVTGVLAPKGEVGMTSPDDLVLVPLSTHQGALFGLDYLTNISVQVESEAVSAAVVERIDSLLHLRHRLAADADNDFEVRSQTEMLQTMDQITGTFTMLLGSVAAVSLLVGGIGIMNIMLVSVRERTREIGVRMAVGAKRRDILLQFLVEAVVVSLAGGLVGVLVGHGAAALVASVAGWETLVPVYATVLSLGVSVAIGIVFGVGPARHASRLDPVEALRHE